MQAYAELETDTPGSIFGITQKPDGKSNSESSANKTKTQGETDFNYEKQDRSGDEEYQTKKRSDSKFYKIFGALLITVLCFNVLSKNENAQRLNYAIARHKGIKIPGDAEDA